MSFDGGAYPNVTVLVGGSLPAVQHMQPANASGIASGQKPVDAVEGVDPFLIAKQMPVRWWKYIRANFCNWKDVQHRFKCSEKLARKWWNEPCGVHADKIAVAKSLHPVQAEQMLFGMAAE